MLTLSKFLAEQNALVNQNRSNPDDDGGHELEVIDGNNWKQKSGRFGSNPGGKHEDEDGNTWYVKHSHTDRHAHNEVLAAKLYQAMGVPTLDYNFVHSNNKLGTATPWEENLEPLDRFDKNHVGLVNKNFGAHAYLANWDAVGLADDNQSITDRGMTTLDTGGSLLFRAQGDPKGSQFGPDVGEFDTLRKYNPHFFGKMKPSEIVDSVRPVAALSDDVIDSHVDQYGHPEDKDNLKSTLKARRQNLVDKANGLADLHGLKRI